MRKKLLVMALLVAIASSSVVYALITRDGGVPAGNNKNTPPVVTEFKAVVNGMRTLDVPVCVNLNDGLTEEEAELIAGTTFILVMGDRVTHRLDTLTFDDTKIEAHYTWGNDENDLGHVFDVSADLTTLQITVAHCF